MKKYIIGMDIGGTNTDAVLIDDKEKILASIKTNTTEDIATGFSAALQGLLNETEIPAEAVRAVLLGTTHATNAILQNQGLYRVGVIRLAGHQPESLPPCFSWPSALRDSLLAGYLTLDGGYECHGSPITPLNRKQAKEAIEKLLGSGVESLAIVGAFSPLNGKQEREIAQLSAEVAGEQFPVSLSHQVGGIGFIERENTTLLNAALKKVMMQGFRQLEMACQKIGLTCSLFITQNNGSLISLQHAIDYPVLTISAGPTNSFIGASRMAGFHNAIVVDIGGTSTDVGLIKNGFPRRSLNASHIGGVRLNFSMPDVLSIALGGGSYIKWESENKNRPNIGPQSAGRLLTQEALCFGGNRLTLTDIAVAMGHLNISGTMARDLPVTPDQARNVLELALQRIQHEVALMEGDQKDLPILLCGGGAALLPDSHLGKRYVIPSHANVANAYGAALAEVAGVIDTVVSLEQRESVLEKLQQEALQKAIRHGAHQAHVKIVDVQITPYHYVPNSMARVTIMASGKHAPTHKC